jgi:hypothetical protein
MLAAATISLSACNIDIAGLTGSVSGNYSLRTINGYRLPFSFPNGLAVANEMLTLDSNGNFTDVAQYSDGRTSTFYGYYTQNNGSVQFTDQSSGFSYQGSVTNGVLTQIVNGYTQTYDRQ